MIKYSFHFYKLKSKRKRKECDDRILEVMKNQLNKMIKYYKTHRRWGNQWNLTSGNQRDPLRNPNTKKIYILYKCLLWNYDFREKERKTKNNVNKVYAGNRA